MKKRLWKQIITIIIICALVTSTFGVDIVFAAGNRKNISIDNLSEGTNNNDIKEESSLELDRILNQCEEIKAKSSTELRKGEIVSVKNIFGDNHNKMAIMSNGDLYCWGKNECGEVGNGTKELQLIPYKVLSEVKSVSYSNPSGLISVSAITENGDLYCWGWNGYGQAGNGKTGNQLTPYKVLSGVKSVSYSSSMNSGSVSAITENGDLYCWGRNLYGRVGNGTTENQLTPYKVLSGVKSVSCPYYSVSVITENGDLYCWGSNENGQVGNGTTENQFTPYKVLSEVKSITYSKYDSSIFSISAITENGDLYCWGSNRSGQIGNGTTENQLIPYKVLSGVKSITYYSYYHHSISAITENGDLYCWGYNWSGEVGNGTTGVQLTPYKVLSRVKLVSCSEFDGFYAISAITENGDLYCWGDNKYGQIGNGTTKDQRRPCKVLSGIKSVSYSCYFYSNFYHSYESYSVLAITENGDLYCWGDNSYGQAGNGTTEKQLTPYKVLSGVKTVVCSNYKSTHFEPSISAIMENGDLYCWGDNSYGQAGNGTTKMQLMPYKVLSKIKSVSYHCIEGSYPSISAIAENGDLYCWGDNEFGQVGNGTTKDQLIPFNVLFKPNNLSAEDFNEYCYRANILMDMRIPSSNTWNEVVNSTGICKRFMDGLDDTKMEEAAYCWEVIHALFDTADNVGNLPDIALKQEDMYKALIFDVLSRYNPNATDSPVDKAREDVNKGMKETNKLVSLLKKNAESSNLLQWVQDLEKHDVSWKDLSLNQKEKTLEVFKKFYKNCMDDGVAQLFDDLDFMDNVSRVATDMMNCIEYIGNYVIMRQMSVAMKTVVYELYNECPSSNISLKYALKYCYKVISESTAEFILDVTAGAAAIVGRDVVSAWAELYWTDVKAKVVASCPEVLIFWAAYKTATYITNLFFGTDDIIEHYFNMAAMREFHNLADNVYRKLRNDYVSSGTPKEAEIYLAANEMLYNCIYTDYDFAMSYTGAVNDALVSKISSLFGDKSLSEAIESMKSIQSSYKLDYYMTLISWIYELENDYPKEYDTYKDIPEKDMEDIIKSYKIACPVDVYIYDETGGLAASVIDNVPKVYSGVMTVIVVGDEKTFYLTDKCKDYSVKYIGNGTGTMDVTICEYSDLNKVREVYFYDLPLQKQSEYSSEITNGVLDKEKYELQYKGENIEADYDSNNINPGSKHKISAKNAVILKDGKPVIETEVYKGQKLEIVPFVSDSEIADGWEIDGGNAQLKTSGNSNYIIAGDSDCTISLKTKEQPGGNDYTPSNCTHLFNDYNYLNPVSGSAVVIYGNGIKQKINGEYINNKQFVAYTDILASYNYTINSKGIVKPSTGKVIAGITKSDTKPVVTKNKIIDKEAAKIAKARIKNGQITVTATGKEKGLVYLWIIDTGSKGVSECCPINVQIAPRRLDVQDTLGNKLKSLQINNGESIDVNIAGIVSSNIKTDDCTYTATVSSGSQNYITVTPVSGTTSQFKITGTGLKNNKNTKASIIFICNENNRKVKFNVIVKK